MRLYAPVQGSVSDAGNPSRGRTEQSQSVQRHAALQATGQKFETQISRFQMFLEGVLSADTLQ